MTNLAREKRKDGDQRQLKAGDWFWRPFYARLWWSAVPLYWSGMAASLRVDWLSAFYGSALAGVVNVFFFPPIVALILSYGFFKAWLAAAEFDFDEFSEETSVRMHKLHSSSNMQGEFDPLNPASGANWIGSPLNPSHPFYVIRHGRSS